MRIQTGTAALFTRFGLGHGPDELQRALAEKYFTLLLESGDLPERILFYTDGVRLACSGSPVLEQLQQLETAGVTLVLCKTCLDLYGLSGCVQVGVVGGMGDILTTLQQAEKVLSL
jgi:sulfur relay (sulfurtransferase) complex TusBCD TusD component (DsrE family)